MIRLFHALVPAAANILRNCRNSATLVWRIIVHAHIEAITMERADAARDARDYRLAAELYAAILKGLPNNAAVHVQAGHMYKEAGELSQAQNHYLAARRLTPDDADLHLQIGHFYKVCGRISDAANAYEEAARLCPGWELPAAELADLSASRPVMPFGSDESSANEIHRRPIMLMRLIAKGRLASIFEFFEDVAVTVQYATSIDNNHLSGLEKYLRLERVVKYLLGDSESLDDIPLFDDAAYRAMHGGLTYWRRASVVHYIRYGEAQGWPIHPLFDPDFYRQKYPEVGESKYAPAAYYLKFGADKGHDPHPLFDVKYYSADIGSTNNALLAYLAAPLHSPHPLFDLDFYQSNNRDMISSGFDPLVHYLVVGNRDPHPLFDSHFYCRTYAHCRPKDVNPLAHYVTVGSSKGFWPNPTFDGDAYKRRYPETAHPDVNALVHFLSSPAIEVRPLVLMIDSAYPRPDHDSGSIDQIMYMRMFQDLGYRVAFAAEGEFNASSDLLDDLAMMQVSCVSPPSYTSILDFLTARSAEISVCFLSRVNFGANYLAHVRTICPHAKVIFNTVDLHHLRELREAELNDDAEARAKAFLTREVELIAITHTDASIVVSDKEAEIVRLAVPGANLFVIPLVRDYTLGRRTQFDGRADIGFIGNYHHLPNVDAVKYFLDQVWSGVRMRLPDVRFFVIGSHLPNELLARLDPGVTWVGHVANLEPWLNRLRLTVAPLRYGAGAKGKVVTSLAYGLPCVMSSIAAEGMGLIDGIHVEIANSPCDMINSIVAIYCDQKRWLALSDASLVQVEKQHSFANGVRILSQLLQSTGIPAPVR